MTISVCPVCRSSCVGGAHAVRAPFIDVLTNQEHSSDLGVRLLECLNCQLTFFSDRYSDQVMRGLYGGYRSEQYLQARRFWEPWYGRSINNALDPGTSEVDERVLFMTSLLNRHVDLKSLRGMVDFGGDVGQFFPKDFSGRKFLIDISDKPPQPGVSRVAMLADVPTEQRNLVIVAHILEHLPDPLATLQLIASQINQG